MQPSDLVSLPPKTHSGGFFIQWQNRHTQTQTLLVQSLAQLSPSLFGYKIIIPGPMMVYPSETPPLAWRRNLLKEKMFLKRRIKMNCFIMTA